jgi:RNA polymerase sigma-70 factor (sigma-E family)
VNRVELVRVGRARRQFEDFVAGSTNDLVRTGYLLTWDLGETEDLVQETFIRIARRWDRVRRMDHPKAYARRILVNLVIDGADKRSRRRAELEIDEGGHAEPVDLAAAEPLLRIEHMSELREALRSLPRQQRAVLVLRFFEDLSEPQVAELLGCSVGTVKKATWRAVGRLRDVLAGGRSPVHVGAPAPNEETR